MNRETYSERVSRIAHDHNVSAKTARHVAAAEIEHEAEKARRARRRERDGQQVDRWNRRTRIKRRQVEGIRYGRPQLIHNGGKP